MQESSMTSWQHQFRPLAIKGDSAAMLSGVESPLIMATK
jgi:hypothetical protein